MSQVAVPRRYNYIGAFLTLRCNYRCTYCINHYGDKRYSYRDANGRDWVDGLNRIASGNDLPVTLQGGEPSVHEDFIYIINHLRRDLKIDILTNIQFDVDRFIRQVDCERLKRKAPYASIRVSFHPEVMSLDTTLEKVLKMRDAGFYVGIWGVLHPKYESLILSAQEKCRRHGIDFRTKAFLGYHKGRLYGAYTYDGACSGKVMQHVLCRTSELLIAPDLHVYRCHADLYAGRNPVGSLLDPGFHLDDAFRDCHSFGQCNPCDVKLKTDRFQVDGHTAVEIRLPHRNEP